MNDTTNKIIKEIFLTNTEDGHNKFWSAVLYDTNLVVCQYGPLDCENPISKEFPDAGEKYFNKKVKEKLNKGYIENML